MSYHKNWIYSKYKKKKCNRCGDSEGKLLIHHKDYNPQNNKKSNLETLCYSCQAKEHKFHSHFKQAYKTEKRNKFGRFGNEKPIEKINCKNCGKRTYKQNPKQKYCSKCKIKLNTRHLKKTDLIKMKNDNR